MKHPFICQSCGKEGDVCDFGGLKCDECDGIVVTRAEMEKIEKQHDEVMNRNTDKTDEWSKLIDDMNGDF